jgi:hypothetical protein
MIPYEELVSALARWRARRGLPTGLGDYLGEPARASFDAHSADHSRDDVVELGDEAIEGMVEPAMHSHGDHAGEADYPVAGDGEAGDDGFDVPERSDLMEFGAPGSEESTKPAGLAGLIDGPDDPAIDAAPPDERPRAAEPVPHAKGRSPRGRRRRK